MPKNSPRRSAVSAVTGRVPCTSSLMRLGWRPLALADRNAIMDYIAEGKPTAALALDE